MGRKIITSLYEFIMTQPATKPKTNPGTTPAPTRPDTNPPPAPKRPGRAFPDREPRPEEEENPMATNFGDVMDNVKSSIVREKGTELAKSLVMRLRGLKGLPIQ